MRAFLTRFWASAISLATLVGLYVGAVSIRAEWAFWIVVVSAVVIAGARPFVRFANAVVNRYQNYPRLLKEFAEADHSAGELRLEIARLREQLDVSYARGVADGESRSLGAALGRGMSEPPLITALTEYRGDLALVGSYVGQATPIEGAWLLVEVIGSGDIKGAVRIVKVNEADETVLLAVAERTVPEFWQRLADRVRSDADPPRGVRLKSYPDRTAPAIGEDEGSEDVD